MSQSLSSLPPHGGFLLVDKPQGLTSHDVVSRVRRLCGIRRVGHAGTLDPMATGLLILAIGPSCRLLQFLVGCDKTYEGEMTLGVVSTTDDAEGNLEQRATTDELPGEGRLREAMARLVGAIEQRPPAHSAIKVGGRRLYDYARRGEEAPATPRRVTVHRFDLLAYNSPRARFLSSVSSGTYIRSLARDTGDSLGCGGHLSALRRLEAGPFQVRDATELPVLEREPERLAKALLPPARVLDHLPAAEVNSETAEKLRHGQPVSCDLCRIIRPWRPGEPIVVLESGRDLVAVAGQWEEGTALRPEVVLS